MANNLVGLGLIGALGGIQVDVNAALLETAYGFQEFSLCDHNCTDETGGYSCPAASSLRRGSRGRFAPAAKLLADIERVAGGIRLAMCSFLGTPFSEYCNQFRIPAATDDQIKTLLSSGRIEVNLFGGNPELHPKITSIIRELKGQGFVVALTTTGRRFMRDPAFLNTILDCPPDIVALSLDDLEATEICALAQLRSPELHTYWRRVNPRHGQRQKAIEAIYVARLARDLSHFPQLLFNVVVHPTNLSQIWERVDALLENFPAQLNLFPVQSAFGFRPSPFGVEHLDDLERFIQHMLDLHLIPHARFVPRLHYWLMLKSVFETFRDQPHAVLAGLAGYQTWQCYRAPGVGRYVQFGAAPTLSATATIPGGHLGCFWNNTTVTVKQQIWHQSEMEIAEYILGGMGNLVRLATRDCPGCVFPRLNFDMVSLELGLAEDLRPNYLQLRQHYVGF